MKRKAKEARCNQNGAAARAKKLVTQCLCKQRRLSFPIAWVADTEQRRAWFNALPNNRNTEQKQTPTPYKQASNPLNPSTPWCSPLPDVQGFPGTFHGSNRWSSLLLPTARWQVDVWRHPKWTPESPGKWTSGIPFFAVIFNFLWLPVVLSGWLFTPARRWRHACTVLSHLQEHVWNAAAYVTSSVCFFVSCCCFPFFSFRITFLLSWI